MTDQIVTQEEHLAALGRYEYGWADADTAGATAQRGLSEAVVRNISALKNEPQWMLDLRLKGLRLGGPHEVLDVVEVDAGEVRAPVGHGLAAE